MGSCETAYHGFVIQGQVSCHSCCRTTTHAHNPHPQTATRTPPTHVSRSQYAGKFFSVVRGCPRSCARTNPWFRGRILGGKCAQEPPPGSAVKHCRFLGTGGGYSYHRLPTGVAITYRTRELSCIRI